METISGLGKLDRERLAALIQRTKGTISVGEAAEILKVSPTDSAKMLARWRKTGEKPGGSPEYIAVFTSPSL